MPKTPPTSTKKRSKKEQKQRSGKTHFNSAPKSVEIKAIPTRRGAKVKTKKEVSRGRGPMPEFDLNTFIEGLFGLPTLDYADLFGRTYVGFCLDEAINRKGLKVAHIAERMGIPRKKVYDLKGIGAKPAMQQITFSLAFKMAGAIEQNFSDLVSLVMYRLNQELERRGLSLPH